MRNFDFYEFTGVLAPGAVTLYGMTRIWPTLAPWLSSEPLTLGDLGVFAVLSYVGGHLVQSLGNWMETGYWKLRSGIPSDWVRTGRRHLLSVPQEQSLSEKIRRTVGVNQGAAFSEIPKAQWTAIVRQLYASVNAAGRSGRIDTFNGNYGMFRGIASAFILLAGADAASPGRSWQVIAALSVAALLAIYRMQRFGVHYARELFVEVNRLGGIGETPGEGHSPGVIQK